MRLIGDAEDHTIFTLTNGTWKMEYRVTEIIHAVPQYYEDLEYQEDREGTWGREMKTMKEL